MIKSLQILSPLNVDELIAKGYTVKIDYEMDSRHSQHSCLGCIMKDGRSLPFFDMDDEQKSITEIGLVGHEWETLLGDIFKEFSFEYDCGEEERKTMRDAMTQYSAKFERNAFSPELVKRLIESGSIWYMLGSIISADTIYNLESAKLSNKYLLDIKHGVEMLDDSVEKKADILKKVDECLDITEKEIENYSNIN